MTQDEIIEMARQAGIGVPTTWRGKTYCEHGNAMLGVELEAFAKLVANKICEELATEAERNGNGILAMQLRGRNET